METRSAGRKGKTCFNCDKTGHLSVKCRQPKKEKGKVVKQVDTEENKDRVESVQQDEHWISEVDVSDFMCDNKPFTVACTEIRKKSWKI